MLTYKIYAQNPISSNAPKISLTAKIFLCSRYQNFGIDRNFFAVTIIYFNSLGFTSEHEIILELNGVKFERIGLNTTPISLLLNKLLTALD